MDIQDLRIFTRVAAVQNLSSVGHEFALTPGTISKRLQSLEDELGVRLFVRSTRSIRITEEGSIFLDHAQRMLVEFDTAKASVDGNMSRPRGRIKLCAPAFLGAHDLALGLSAFASAYPEIDVHVDICDRWTGPADDGFDMTIRTGMLADSSLIAKRLADDPLLVVASPDYLKTNGTPRTPQDLERHSCLVHGDACHWPFRKKTSDRSVRVSGRIRSNDLELLHRLARDGHGLVRISAAHVAEDMIAGSLVPVLTDFDTSGDSAIWATFPKTRHMLPRLRALIDFLTDWLKQPAPGVEAIRKRNGLGPPTIPVVRGVPRPKDTEPQSYTSVGAKPQNRRARRGGNGASTPTEPRR